MNSFHLQRSHTFFAAVSIRSESRGHSPRGNHLGDSIILNGCVKPKTHKAGIRLKPNVLEEYCL